MNNLYAPVQHVKVKQLCIRSPKAPVKDILEVGASQLAARIVSWCSWTPSVERPSLELYCPLALTRKRADRSISYLWEIEGLTRIYD